MRVPYSWLREYCDPGVEPGELAERLAMTGTEVERVGTIGPPSAEGFVVGRVLSGRAAPRRRPAAASARSTPATASATIVCGAPNVAAGQTVAGRAAGRAHARRARSSARRSCAGSSRTG